MRAGISNRSFTCGPFPFRRSFEEVHRRSGHQGRGSRQGVFITLDDVYKKIGDAQGGWYEGVDRATNTTEIAGGRTGIPFGVNGNLLLRRTDLLEPKGFTAPPATWDELVAQAVAVNAPPVYGLGLALSNVGDGNLQVSVLQSFGGRIAEEIIFGPESITTGASNDIERATEIARNMVTKWGLSSRLGPLTYSEDQGEVFLGRSVTQHKQVSDVTAHAIDEEVRRLIDENYHRAKDILESNLDKLHKMAEALIKYETIDENQIKDIMQGRDPQPPSGWDDSAPPMGKSRDRGETPEAPIGKPASQH